MAVKLKNNIASYSVKKQLKIVTNCYENVLKYCCLFENIYLILLVIKLF